MPIHQTHLLQEFTAEVSNAGPEACLPSALSARWLIAMRHSVRSLLAGENSTEGSLAVAAVFTLLQGKGIAISAAMADDAAMASIFDDYGIELSLECVHRGTEVKYQAATLDTIFTKRDVDMWRESVIHH